jgi:hypothetical protein
MNAPNLLTRHNEGEVFSLFFKTYLMPELNYKMPNAHCKLALQKSLSLIYGLSRL